MITKTSKIVLGLDLAEKAGICVLNGTTKQLMFSSSIKLSRGGGEDRLVHLHKLLNKVIEKFNPTEVAIEDVFLPAKTSPRTPISLGELRGVARLCAAEHQLPVFFYPPRKAKMILTGNGNATKADIINWVQAEFGISVRDDNEADSISIAYTHILSTLF